MTPGELNMLNSLAIKYRRELAATDLTVVSQLRVSEKRSGLIPLIAYELARRGIGTKRHRSILDELARGEAPASISMFAQLAEEALRSDLVFTALTYLEQCRDILPPPEPEQGVRRYRKNRRK